jgi:hypothetical protein
VERVGDVDSEPLERLQPVLGLLTRVGDVIQTLRQRAEELGLAQWGRTLEESLQDLSTATELLRLQEAKRRSGARRPMAEAWLRDAERRSD